MRAMTRKLFSARDFRWGVGLAILAALVAATPAGAADQRVTLGRTPGGPIIYQPTGPVTLTAHYTGTGSTTGFEYQFWYQLKDASSNYVSFLACDWDVSTTCQISAGADITATGKYTFQAYARRPGSLTYDYYSAGDRADIISPQTPSGNYPDDWVAYGRTRVFFNWAAPPDMTGVTGYELQIENKDLDQNTFKTPSGTNAQADLEAGYSYRWWVRTRLGVGVFGPYSTEKNFAIAVPRPLLPLKNAFINAPTVDISWTPVTPGNGYVLTVHPVNPVDLDQTFTISGNLNTTQLAVPLAPDTDYQWWVKATVPGLDAGISPPITFYSGPTPPGIANVSAPPIPAQGLAYTLTWTARSVPLAGVAVAEIWYYHGSTATWQQIGGPPITGPIVANDGTNHGSFIFTIPNMAETARFWVGSCHVTQLTGPGGRCAVFPYGAAAGPTFIVP